MTIERASTSARASRAVVASARRDGARATRRARGAARGVAAAIDDGASFVPGSSSMAERHEYGGDGEYSRCVRGSMRRARRARRARRVESAMTRGLTMRFLATTRSFDALQPYKVYFPEAHAYDVKSKVATPGRYRVKLPKGYDANRAQPYPTVICINGEAGFGPRDGKVSLTSSVSKTKRYKENEAIIVECSFNTPTWLNDSSTMNHESYLLKVMLPHFRASHNAGKMFLLGFGTGGYGALSLLMRRPNAFEAVVAADVPILGGYKAIERPWEVKDLARPSHWGSWNEAFPRDEDWTPYDVTQIVRDAWVRDQLNADGSRIALVPGKKTVAELGDFIRSLEEYGVAHDVVAGFEGDDIDRQGAWVDAALEWLAPKLA